MSQYPRVRAQHTCVRCGGSKDAELLLCWSCHHKEKRENGGGYSRRIEFAIEAWEARLERHAKRELSARESLPAVSRASHYS